MRTLRFHRETLASNPDAYIADLPRLQNTVVDHLKSCGYSKVTFTRCPELIEKYVNCIFETQDRKPFFHIGGSLPYCWNSPKDWDKDFIRYEWGHLRSRNQNESAHKITNLCLQSARCNQHIQTSMDIDEVLKWLEGSVVEHRVQFVLTNRRILFESSIWNDLLRELNKYR